MIKFFISFLLFPFLLFSQTKNFTGVVSDTLNKPLESANIIAKPLQEKAQLKFAIAKKPTKPTLFATRHNFNRTLTLTLTLTNCTTFVEISYIC